MKIEDINNALGYIDYDLVEEYVAEKEKLSIRARQRRQLMYFARTAACLVVLIGIMIPIVLLGTKMTSPPNTSGENPTYTTTTPVVPPTGNPPGSSENTEKPGGDDGVIQKPSEYRYTYKFAYNGTEYICVFGHVDQSLSEALKGESVDLQLVGEYIGEVMAIDQNGERGWYKIYQADYTNLIIEIKGYHMTAQRK